MSTDGFEDFVCPHCASAYKLVSLPADPPIPSDAVVCAACSKPFPTTREGSILKYFMVSSPGGRIAASRRLPTTPGGSPEVHLRRWELSLRHSGADS